MVEEKIVDEVVKIINMYFNNQDWQGYLRKLKNKENVIQGLIEILDGNR